MSDRRAERVPLPEKQIILQPFSHRLSAWPDDDWSGVSDPKQRRRLQNRVNQRARRLRNKTQETSSLEDRNVEHDSPSSTAERRDLSLSHAITHQNNDLPSSARSGSSVTSSSVLGQIDDVHILDLGSATTQAIMQRLENMAHRLYTLGSPRVDCLLQLIQLNFTRALIENTKILGLTRDKLHDDALSPFNTASPWQNAFEHSLPSSLQPTVIQRRVLHHPWLDLLPDPQMRDNLISAGESYDETKLCLDLKGCGSVRTGQTGIIVWREPWDPSGWEVTEAFARTWGWVLRDCWDLFRSTNYWRAQRNEKPLFRVP